jgi:NAD(P)-dependent dehydrogenase (short-subunit alcohol dehydrogenase family)
MDLGLKGLRACVTGGSRGIGLAIARVLADEGASVALCARGASGVESARKDLEARGVRVHAEAIDVREPDLLRGFVTRSAERLGGLDILVSNPSGGGGTGDDAWRSTFEVDLMGAVRSVEAALPALAKSPAASVVFISSTAALETFMGPTSYNALKAALIVHGNGLSQALAAQKIRVNTVSPGPILIEGGSWDQVRKAAPQMYDATLAQIPLGRMGSDAEVARAVAFLASPAAAFITGVNLVIDGGFTKRVDF